MRPDDGLVFSVTAALHLLARSARACYCCGSGARYNSARSTMAATKKHRNTIFSTVCPPRTTRLEREGIQNQRAGNDRTQDQSEKLGNSTFGHIQLRSADQRLPAAHFF